MWWQRGRRVHYWNVAIIVGVVQAYVHFSSYAAAATRSIVALHVAFQVVRFAEGAIANGAAVRFHSQVNYLDVAVEISNVGKHRRAKIARDRSRLVVNILHMRPQLVHGRLPQSTERAGMILNSLVSHRMFREFMLGGEFFSANLAHERHLVGRMNELMLLKRPVRSERFAAGVTHE